jgi:hypothetical protein
LKLLIVVEVNESGSSLSKFAAVLPDVEAVALQGLADYATVCGEELSPRVSGLMSQSWYVARRCDSGYSVSNRAPYFLYFIEGTAPHEIRPRFAAALRFAVGGQVVFTRLVNHPGTKSHDLLQRVAADVASEVPRFVGAALKDAVAEAEG